jgi:predicted ATPase
MANALNRLTIRGFKSIRELEDLELRSLNILIGANGAGKSNFISVFRMLQALIDGNLNRFVRDSGGAGDLLFNGRKVTQRMEFRTYFDVRGFRFDLVPTPKDACAIENEARYYEHGASGWWELGDRVDGTSRMVAEVKEGGSDAKYSKPVYYAISAWRIYHFHDTSSTAAMRHAEIVQDNENLRSDASNIGPFLRRLKEEETSSYQDIINAIRLVTPFFDDFTLKPSQKGEKQVVDISWRQKGSDYPMQPYHLSDGTMRFICLATALLQPDPPSTIIIDEPELGLHPEAIAVLAELIQAASKQSQLIVASQSPALISHFSLDDIIVVNRKDGQSTFERMASEDFTVWLEDYSVGELWEKNVIAGGTNHE